MRHAGSNAELTNLHAAPTASSALVNVLIAPSPLQLRPEAVLDGLDPALFRSNDPDARVPLVRARAAWLNAQRHTGRDQIGLALATSVPPGGFGIVEYMARFSQTLRESLRILVRYQRLLADIGEMRFDETAAGGVLTHRAHGAVANITELLFGLIIVRARTFSGRPIHPLATRLSHKALGPSRDYEEVFSSPVAHRADTDQLVFSRADLDAPFVSAEPPLSRLLSAHADELLRNLGAKPGLLSDFRDAAAHSIARGDGSLTSISRALGSTPRTIQRRLAQLGLTPRVLIDEVRREAAKASPQDGRKRDDVAHELGYSSARSLRRARRRWLGGQE